jgi:hypothetical protein
MAVEFCGNFFQKCCNLRCHPLMISSNLRCARYINIKSRHRIRISRSRFIDQVPNTPSLTDFSEDHLVRGSLSAQACQCVSFGMMFMIVVLPDGITPMGVIQIKFWRR